MSVHHMHKSQRLTEASYASQVRIGRNSPRDDVDVCVRCFVVEELPPCRGNLTYRANEI